MTRLCQANSLWTNTQPTCDPKDCGAPGVPLHGSVVAASTLFKAVATYACGSGYTLSGALTRTCQSDQTWSAAVPICVPVDCGVPGTIVNGTAGFSATVFGSSATYSCATNFTISGTGATVTCQADGLWSTPRPSCVDVCAVAGNVGTASHCCSSAACAASTPICSVSKVCTQCPAGSCNLPTDPCKAGVFSCTTGAAVCVSSGNAPDGQICSAGECVGGACLPATVDQQQLMRGASSGPLGGTNSNQKLAQVVTAGLAGPLAEVRLPVSCTSGAAITVQIQGVTALGAPDGNILSSVSVQPGMLPADGSLRAIRLTTPVNLALGMLFAIVAIGPQTDSCAITFGPPGDTYPAGKSFFDARPNPPGWVENTGDLPFQTVMGP